MIFVYVNTDKTLAAISKKAIGPEEVEQLEVTQYEVTDVAQVALLDASDAIDRYHWLDGRLVDVIDEVKVQRVRLAAVCEKKQGAAAEMIRGVSPYTSGMIAIDKRRYERALRGTLFASAAENAVVISKHEAFLDDFDAYIDLLDFGRKGVNEIIDAGDVDRAKRIIGEFEMLGKDTTLESLERLLSA